MATLSLDRLDFAKAEAPTVDLVTPLKPQELLWQALSFGLHPRIHRLAYAYGTFQLTSEPDDRGIERRRDVGIGKTRGFHGSEKKKLEQAARRAVVDEVKLQYHRNCVNVCAVVQNWAKSAQLDPDVAAVVEAKIAARIDEPTLPIRKEFWNPPKCYRITGSYTVTPEDVKRTDGKVQAGLYDVIIETGAYSPLGAMARATAALFPRAWKLAYDLTNLTVEELDEPRDNTITITELK